VSCATEEFTLPCEQRDFVEWRQGRSEFAVWAIDLDLPELVALSAQNQSRMQDFLLADYLRQPHITLQIAGFPGVTAKLADDFTPQQMQAQIARLKAIKQAPFTIEVAGVDSFTSAAYFTVNDGSGGIARVRQALACVGDDDFPYTPHVTFGLYRAAFPMATVLHQLSAGPIFEPLQLTINKVSLLTYQAAVIGGALSTAFEFDLSEHLLRSTEKTGQKFSR
jgi:2'-5' RNA ligase